MKHFPILVFQGIVLVYDITNKDTFSMIDYWMESIDKVSGIFGAIKQYWTRLSDFGYIERCIKVFSLGLAEQKISNYIKNKVDV